MQPTPLVAARPDLEVASSGAMLADPFGLAAGGGGGGERLPDPLRGRFEQSLGTDLGDVRVHHDAGAASAAADVGARAFALGRDVVMGAGQYAPHTPDGDALLAHEVAHTVQQQRGGERLQAKSDIGDSSEAAEAEADVAAAAMVVGRPASVSAAPIAIARNPPTAVVGSSDVANAPTATERAVHGRGSGRPEIGLGLDVLEERTQRELLASVVETLDVSNRADADWHGAQAERAPRVSLSRLCSEIWYLASQMYVVDRTGHIVPGDFRHEINVATLQPGGVYFWGELHITGQATRTAMQRLFRVDGGVRIVNGDIRARTGMGEIDLIERAGNAMRLHHGIGIIVSPHAATERRQHGFDGERLWRALRHVPGHVPWAVRTGAAELLDNPTQALINQVQNQVSARAFQALGRAAGPVQLVMLMHAGWELGHNLSIASGEHATDDEIDVAAQAVARQLVSMVVGELVDRGLARAGRALRARGGTAPHPSTPRTPDAPATPHGSEPAAPTPQQPSTPHGTEPATPPPAAPATPSPAAPPAAPHATVPPAPHPTQPVPHPSNGTPHPSQPVPPPNNGTPHAGAPHADAPSASTPQGAPAVVHPDGQTSPAAPPQNRREHREAARRNRGEEDARAYEAARNRADARRDEINAERDRMLHEDQLNEARRPAVESQLRDAGLNTPEIDAAMRAFDHRRQPDVSRFPPDQQERLRDLLGELHDIHEGSSRQITSCRCPTSSTTTWIASH